MISILKASAFFFGSPSQILSHGIFLHSTLRVAKRHEKSLLRSFFLKENFFFHFFVGKFFLGEISQKYREKIFG